MLSGITGSTSGMRTDGFSVPGYEWQQGGGQAAAQPPAPAPYAPPPHAQPPHAQPPNAQPPHAAPAATAPTAPVDYANLPAQPPSAYATTPAAPPTTEQNTEALLLVRAMIAAAFADGTIDDAERADILGRLDAAGVGSADRELFLQELASPKPVTALVSQVKSPDVAEQFYIVSMLAMNRVDGVHASGRSPGRSDGADQPAKPVGAELKVDTDAERAYARMLPLLLGLSADQVAAIHQKAGLPAVT
jgi:uncharacterized membrane protein YebE (DUF533 family)